MHSMTVLLHREPRGLALATAGGCLLVTAALPSSPGCPMPLLDRHVPARDWVHVPMAVTALHLLPLTTSGRLRRLLGVNMLLLGPSTLVSPHGPLTAVLQRTMTALGAVALGTWSPSSPATRSTSTT